ncbi:MAG: GlsB/YeaQ/YmgE family stress response membrane protein [Thiobacillaceae bacterium]|nr:GlsB/YeaQ/YmgE family stress response membrane protein [Thiobacillaceae bacterium]
MSAMTGAAIGGVIGLLIVALIGLVIGAVAKMLMPGPDPGGWFVTILLGIAGSWVGNFLFGLVGLHGVVLELVGAVLGAMLLLWIYRMVKGKKPG